ncbi:MAG: thiol:disulfide interchange protein DsbA/DsbL [Gammaproteobacteria bacterium]|nr:thiol:disulfide interchange protein DsbA/DsbL [Gammaproteobacteria bacterium]
MKTILAAAAGALLLASTVSAAEFEEGVHYRELAEQQTTQTGDKVEVRELFWYQCPHCYNLEKPLRDWIATMPDNAAFVEQPAVLTGSWEFHARVYYTLQALGVLDQFHGPLFDAIHKKPRPLNRVTDPTPGRGFGSRRAAALRPRVHERLRVVRRGYPHAQCRPHDRTLRDHRCSVGGRGRQVHHHCHDGRQLRHLLQGDRTPHRTGVGS